MESDNPDKILRDTYIITIKKSPEYDRLRVSSGKRKTLEEKNALNDEKQRMMMPIREYLEDLGLRKDYDYSIKSNLCTVVACLTTDQAKFLKCQPYVENLIEDFKTHLIE